MDLREIGDRLAIEDLLVRYCYALDRQDWPAFERLFTADARLDFTAFGGPSGDPATLRAFLEPILRSLHGAQHAISTLWITLDGDRARAQTAAQVALTARGADGRLQTTFSGLWYHDTLLRGADGWRIRERVQQKSWMSTAIAVEPPAP